MNRNTNAHFSQLPAADIKRSILDRSCEHKFTANVGELIPIYYDEILPGDTVSIDTSKVIRFQTMLSPVMDNLIADFYWFFVPNRLVWDHWVNFCGENTASAWVPTTQYTIPLLKVPPTGTTAGGNVSNNYVGSILDYLGYPVEMSSQTGDVDVNALPVRGYAKICDDWFRDENLTDPLNIYTGDSTSSAIQYNSYVDDVPRGGAPFKVAKTPDFWTSMLPAPQKGNSVLINPYGQWLPVTTRDKATDYVSSQDGLILNNHTGTPSTPGYWGLKIESGSGTNVQVNQHGSNPSFSAELAASANLAPSNLWADGANFIFSVNDLRFAFQFQKLLEKDALGGTRYKETIKAHFNVDVPDARLQRSEYLGGNRVPIKVSQVQNTAQTSSDPLGDLGAYSVTADYHSDFTKSFTEHGQLYCVMCVRIASHTYCQGLEPFWNRRNRFDYYWPVFANIGEQPYKKDGLYIGATGTFGYQEAWADYRYKTNRVSGEMRPYVTNNLGSWTFADDYSSAPSLSDGWIREDMANVDRTLAVTSSTSNQFWSDVYFKVRHTRPMPVYSIPGFIDHH